MPCGSTRPSSSGLVLGLSDSAMLRSSRGAFMDTSFRFGAGEAHEGGQALRLVGNEPGELLLRPEPRLGAEPGELVLHVVGLEALEDGGAQPGDDRGRRTGWRQDAGPRRASKIGNAAFDHGRELGQLRQPLLGDYREAA